MGATPPVLVPHSCQHILLRRKNEYTKVLEDGIYDVTYLNSKNKSSRKIFLVAFYVVVVGVTVNAIKRFKSVYTLRECKK
jgi:hypothetical protein